MMGRLITNHCVTDGFNITPWRRRALCLPYETMNVNRAQARSTGH